MTLTTILREALAAGWTHASLAGADFAPIREVLERPHDWPVAGPYQITGAQVLDGQGGTPVRLRRAGGIPRPCTLC